MKKGCFLVYDAGNTFKDCATSGIMKKIKAQVGAMNIEGKMSCDLILIPQTIKNRLLLVITYLFRNQFEKYEDQVNQYDFIYVRRFLPPNKGLIHLLKEYKKKS